VCGKDNKCLKFSVVESNEATGKLLDGKKDELPNQLNWLKSMPGKTFEDKFT